MKKSKVDIKAATIAAIRISKTDVTTKEITALMSTMGHSVAPGSVAALLAWHRC